MDTNTHKNDSSLHTFLEHLLHSKSASELIDLFYLTTEQSELIFNFIKEFKEDIHTLSQSLQEESKEVLSANNMVLKAYLEELHLAKSFEEKQVIIEKVEEVRKSINKLHSNKYNSFLFAGSVVLGTIIIALSKGNYKKLATTSMK